MAPLFELRGQATPQDAPTKAPHIAPEISSSGTSIPTLDKPIWKYNHSLRKSSRPTTSFRPWITHQPITGIPPDTSIQTDMDLFANSRGAQIQAYRGKTAEIHVASDPSRKAS